MDVDGELVPEFLYTQIDAESRGTEGHPDFELFHAEPHHLLLALPFMPRL
ncbi:MAG TPA: hypothetical protein VGR67_08940 [Candidatus Polarisedimenticolia bacterium]|nr:hypothetical protein [Candidatus Polarisedimenticolia bacterium]